MSRRRLAPVVCPHATSLPGRRFGRFGRLLPFLLALVMLGNVIDCVRVEPRGPITMHVAQRRPNRKRGARHAGS